MKPTKGTELLRYLRKVEFEGEEAAALAACPRCNEERWFHRGGRGPDRRCLGAGNMRASDLGEYDSDSSPLYPCYCMYVHADRYTCIFFFRTCGPITLHQAATTV